MRILPSDAGRALRPLGFRRAAGAPVIAVGLAAATALRPHPALVELIP